MRNEFVWIRNHLMGFSFSFRKDAITLRDDAHVQLDLSWELLRMAMDDVRKGCVKIIIYYNDQNQ